MRGLGIGPGDEVITTPLSFIATANAVALNGGIPVFADIDDDLNLDPATIEALVTPRTKAILPVHWAGKMARMEEIQEVAARHRLLVVEDCSQAFGASRHGVKAGGFGIAGCYSMNSMKVLASLGEAGAVATDDETLAARIVSLRYNGLVDREICQQPSHNGRIDTIQAAMLLKRLDRYDSVLSRREETAAYYDRHLADIVGVPRREEGCQDVHYTYQIQTDDRDRLRDFLESQGIEARVQHVPLMPHQPAYRGHRHACPNADRLIQRTLCLPVGEKITPEQREYVVAMVRRFHGA